MATKQAFPRLAALILATTAALTAAPATAGGNWLPLLPDQDFYDFQLFAPPDLQEYAIRPDPQEGLFFTYDRTYWALTPPPSKAILNEFFIPVQPLAPSSIAQLNNDLIRSGYPGSATYVFGSDPFRFDLNTNWMRTTMAWGNRFEGGWVYDDYGMLFSYYDSGPQSQNFNTSNAFALNSPTTTFTQDVEAVPGGIGAGAVLVVTTIESTSPPPDHVVTQSLRQVNSTEMRSGGFAWTIRRNLSSANSGQLNTVRFSFGGKFLQVADRYSINYRSYQAPFAQNGNAAGLGTGVVPNGNGDVLIIDGNGGSSLGTPLQHGSWDTSTYNNIAGPEFGLNYQIERGRWRLETDLRFVAGMNWQNALYRGSNFPAALGADYFRSTYTFANTLAASGNAAGNVSAPPLFVQIFGLGQTNATNTAEHNFVFAPLGEWRLRGRYKVSQAVSLNVGYTGMWLGAVTRASSNTVFKETLRPVVTATQNGPPINSPVLNASGQPTGQTIPVTSWTPPPINAGNTNARVYNQIAPANGNDLGYMFVNGVDFGIEVNY